jgi:hypothetical protein
MPDIKLKTAGTDLKRLFNGKFIPERKNTGSCKASDTCHASRPHIRKTELSIMPRP